MKKIIAFSILGVSVATSLFIFNSPKNISGEELGLLVSNKNIPSNLSFKSATIVNNAADSLNYWEQGTLLDDNFTDKMAQSYLRQIFNDNNGELKQVDGKNALLATPIEKMIEENPIDHAIYQISYKTFSKREIVIIDDNSKEKQLTFLSTLKVIQEKNLSEIKIQLLTMTQDFLEKRTIEKLEQYMQAGQKITTELLKVSTPSQWTNIHIQNLNLWQKKITVLKALMNYDNDPIKAVVALNELPQLIEETNSLEKIAAEKFKILVSQ